MSGTADSGPSGPRPLAPRGRLRVAPDRRPYRLSTSTYTLNDWGLLTERELPRPFSSGSSHS